MKNYCEDETYSGFSDSEDFAYMYSTNKSKITEMRKMNKKYPEDTIIAIDDGYGLQINVPKDWFVGLRVKSKRDLSDDVRSARSQSMKNYNKQK